MIKYAYIWKLPKQVVMTKQSLGECSHTQTADLTNIVRIKNVHVICMCLYWNFVAILKSFLVSTTLSGPVVLMGTKDQTKWVNIILGVGVRFGVKV